MNRFKYDLCFKGCKWYNTCRVKNHSITNMLIECKSFKERYRRIKKGLLEIKQNRIMKLLKSSIIRDEDLIDYESFSNDKLIEESLEDESMWEVIEVRYQ